MYRRKCRTSRLTARFAGLMITALTAACAQIPLTTQSAVGSQCPVDAKLVCSSDRPTLADTHGAPDGICRCMSIQETQLFFNL